jgi:hypothetical protein
MTVLEAQAAWRPYSPRTKSMSTGGVECKTCTSRTTQPGAHGWWWRPLPPQRRPRGLRAPRAESVCNGCAAKLLTR